MQHKDLIIYLFKEYGEHGPADISRDPDHDNRFSVFVKIKRNSRGFQRPSKHKLNKISKQLEIKGLTISYILIDGEENDILATIKTALDYRFSEYLNNVFVNSTSDNVVVWIEPKRNITMQKQEEISEAAKDLLNAMNVIRFEIQYTNGASLATPTAVLSAIRLNAPASKEAITAHLRRRKLEVPSEEWMDRMLDRIRKSGRILRISETQEFALTLRGLTSLGSRKDRHSPDVLRALALAKRQR